MEARQYPDMTDLFAAMEARRYQRAMEQAGARSCVGCGQLTLMVCICESKPHLCPSCECPNCGQR